MPVLPNSLLARALPRAVCIKIEHAGTEVPAPLPENNVHANCVTRDERRTGRIRMGELARDASKPEYLRSALDLLS